SRRHRRSTRGSTPGSTRPSRRPRRRSRPPTGAREASVRRTKPCWAPRCRTSRSPWRCLLRRCEARRASPRPAGRAPVCPRADRRHDLVAARERSSPWSDGRRSPGRQESAQRVTCATGRLPGRRDRPAPRACPSSQDLAVTAADRFATMTCMDEQGQPEVNVKPRSHEVTSGYERAPARAMLRAVGMTDEDWDKPQVGVASSWNEITPCNLSLQRLAQGVKEGVRDAGGFPLEFGTISVSDGISMGHEGMRSSLVSREIIADSVECVMHAERLDGSVLLAGCDKSLPGMLMAAGRLNLASVFLYAGSILPGNLNGNDITIQDAFEGVGACALGRITPKELEDIERHACPGEGACGGMFTANTMASAAEALGMSLPGSASPPAVDRRRDDSPKRAGEAVVAMLRKGITARQIMTREAFENAITVVTALGGSTNAVLHLLAIAREAEVDLSIDDFNRIGERTPLLADVKPFGRYVMSDIDKIGGLPVVMKALLDAGLLHGDTLTVTGKTMAENLADINPPDPDGKIISALSKPLAGTGGLTILRGSLAPDGAVVKSASLPARVMEGTARVFD